MQAAVQPPVRLRYFRIQMRQIPLNRADTHGFEIDKTNVSIRQQQIKLVRRPVDYRLHAARSSCRLEFTGNLVEHAEQEMPVRFGQCRYTRCIGEHRADPRKLLDK